MDAIIYIFLHGLYAKKSLQHVKKNMFTKIVIILLLSYCVIHAMEKYSIPDSIKFRIIELDRYKGHIFYKSFCPTCLTSPLTWEQMIDHIHMHHHKCPFPGCFKQPSKISACTSRTYFQLTNCQKQ